MYKIYYKNISLLLFLLIISFISTAHAISPGGVAAGLKFWLEASNGVTQSAGAVGSWADQSGLSNDATQSTGANKPTITNGAINGNPTINFDGSGSYFILPTINLTGETEVFTVMKMGDNGAGRGPLIGLENNNNSFSNSGDTWVSKLANIATTFSGLAPISYSIIGQQQSDTNNLFRVIQNGVDAGSIGMTTSANFNIDRIGRSNATSAQYYMGNIAEIAAYSSVLTGTQEAQVQSYLAIKHGITLSDPTATTTIAENQIQNGNANVGTAAGGQSFIATKSNTVTDVVFRGAPVSSDTINFYICNGEQNSAPCISSAIRTQSLSISGAFNTYQNIHLASPLSIVAGQQYTFIIKSTTQNLVFAINGPGTAYTGGNAIVSGSIDTTSDMYFEILHVQAGIPDYMAADGITHVWTRASAGAFTQDIAGIATDNTSGLAQTGSQSINVNSLIEINNATAQSTGDYLTWSSNGSSTLATSSLTISSINYKRMSRAWYRQQTGSIGNVDIVLHTTGSAFAGGDLTKIKMLTSNLTTFVGANTIAPSSISGNDITYSGVNLASTYFTFAEGPASFTGIVYTDKGITNIGAGIAVKIIVNGATTTVGTTTAGGLFSIPIATPNAGDVMTFAINDGANFGVVVNKWNGSTYSGYDIYQNTLITRSDNGVALTDLNLDTANDGTTAITSIYNNNGVSTLTVLNNKSLMVWPGSTFTPGGAMTIGSGASTGELRIDGILNAATNTITLRGSFNAATGTLIQTGILLMNGTGAVTYDQGATSTGSNLSAQNTSGITVINNPMHVNILSVGSGFVFLNGKDLTVDTTFTNNAVLRLVGSEVVSIPAQDIDSGTWTYAGDADGLPDIYIIKDFGATDYYALIVNATDTNDIFNFTSNIVATNSFALTSGIVNTNTFNFDIGTTYTQNTGTSTFNGGSGITTVVSNMTITGTGTMFPTFNASSGPLLIGGNFSSTGVNSIFNGSSGTMYATGTFGIAAGVFIAPSATTTLLSNFTNNNANFNHNNGTVLFAKATVGNQTITTASTTFNNLIKVDTVADGTALTLNFANASSITVAGRLTLQGNATDDLIIKTNTAGNMHNIDSISGLYTVNDVNVRDSTLKLNGTIKSPVLNPSSSVNVSNTFGWFGNGAIVELSTNTNGLENSGTSTPRIYINGIISATTTVTITDLGSGSATNGIDYTFTSPQTVTIPAGTYDGLASTSISIPTFAIIGDTLAESNETIILDVSLATGDATLGDANGDTATTTSTTHTIINDDIIQQESVSITTITNAAEPTTNGSFRLTLSTTSTTTINVVYTISGTAINGTDYITLSGTSTIATGTTTASILINVTDDALSEGIENIILNITSTDNTLYIASSTASTTTITIADNDTPGITVTPLTINMNEVGPASTYTVVLNTQPTATTTISIATSTINARLSTTTLIFTTINWNVPQTVSVSAVNLGLTIGIGTNTALHTLVSTDANYSFTSTTTVNINITNNYTGPTLPTVISPLLSTIVASSTTVTVQCQSVGDIVKVYGNITPSPSIITCASTGTTTVSITFSTTTSPQSIGVTITDIYGNVSATTTVSGLLIDSDGDNVTDTTENAGANGGDGNGDGIADKLQAHVLGAINPVTGKYSTLVAAGSCTFIKALQFVNASSLATADGAATYPVGLADFTVQCPSAGQSSSLTIYYTQQYSTSTWIYKKYNSTTHIYTDRSSGATFGTAIVGSSTVTTVSFTATDGDASSDEDAAANNYIVDPSGPAVVTIVPIIPIVSTISSGGGGGGIIWPIINQIKSTSSEYKLQKLLDLIGGEEPNVPAEFSKYVCNRYLRSYIYTGKENKVSEVKKLQGFLNVSQNENLTVDGVYDDQDIAAVKRFQTKYEDQILAPWGVQKATGVVGKTTIAKINIMMCSTQKGCPYFESYLKEGDESLEVVKLQDFLNIIFAPTSGYPSKSIPLSKAFTYKTTKSLKEFQTVYKDIVLKPWDLKSATGWFYQTSKHASNKLLECNGGSILLDNGKSYK